MSHRVLIGTSDTGLAAQASALIAEDSGLAVVGTASDAAEVIGAIEAQGVDVVLLHEDIGPLPIMDLAREIGGRFPQVGIVLMVRERTPELLRAALQAGARDVLALPLSFEEVHGVRNAGEWSQTLRRRVTTPDVSVSLGVGGTMVAVAGAKGGVGTSTMAVHLALEVARAGRGRSVCLVDLDLQAGDIGVLLDLTHRRSISDLLGVVHELSPAVLEDTLYVHESGLRILLAPEIGEHEEDVSATAARRILGALRSNFDVVVVDVGTTVTEGNAVAVEMADRVLVVTTPDVPALRSANRLLSLWDRLEIRNGNISAVVNRVNRDTEVQPDLVRKVVDAPVAKTAVPAGFRDLEPATNTGVPARLPEGSVRTAFSNLAREFGLAPKGGDRKKSRVLGQAGQVAVETVGVTVLLILLTLLIWQMVLTGFTYVIAGHSAREGARAMAVDDPVAEKAREDVPGAWRDGMKVDEGSDYVEVTLSVPVIVPGLDGPFRISGRSGGVPEDEPLPDNYDKP